MSLLEEFDPMNPHNISPDSELGKKLGFTSDKFDGMLCFRPEVNMITLTMIKSKVEHKGNVKALLDKIFELGYSMDAVPVSDRMRLILLKFGFKERKNDGYMVYLNPKYYSKNERLLIYSMALRNG